MSYALCSALGSIAVDADQTAVAPIGLSLNSCTKNTREKWMYEGHIWYGTGMKEELPQGLHTGLGANRHEVFVKMLGGDLAEPQWVVSRMNLPIQIRCMSYHLKGD